MEGQGGFPSHIEEAFRHASQQVQAQRGRQDGGRGNAVPYDHMLRYTSHSGHIPAQIYPRNPQEPFLGPPAASDSLSFPPLGSRQPPLGSRQPPRSHSHHSSVASHASSRAQRVATENAQAFFAQTRGGSYRNRRGAPFGQNQPQMMESHSDYARHQPPQLSNPASSTSSSLAAHSRFHSSSRHQAEYLSHVASELLKNELTQEQLLENEAFRKQLEKILHEMLAQYAKADSSLIPHSVRLKCFGSLASGFGVQGSDMDLLLMFPKDNVNELLEIKSRRMLEKALLDADIGAHLLTNTRVPILKVCQKPSPEILADLRRKRKIWEEEEQAQTSATAHPFKSSGDRLPILSPEEVEKAAQAFAQLDVTAVNIGLPDSPTRQNAHFEYDADCGIQCDINFTNHVAIHNTALLRCYCKSDRRVKQMGLFVKAWAKARDINTPYHGTLSSYGYILMTLHYLMNIARPPVIPNYQHMAVDADAWNNKTDIQLFEGFDVRFFNDEKQISADAAAGRITSNRDSLGSLLRGFFKYYGNSSRDDFQWLADVISIRTRGGLLSKRSKGWTEAKWADEASRIRLRYLLAIEDPFEIEHNIARTVGHSGIVAIRDEFRRAWKIINRVQPLSDSRWQWLEDSGQVGEDFLNVIHRGDLMKKDLEFHRQKMKMLATKRAETGTFMSPAPEVLPTDASSESKPHRSHPKLTPVGKSQTRPIRRRNQQRRVKVESDSGDEVEGQDRAQQGNDKNRMMAQITSAIMDDVQEKDTFAAPGLDCDGFPIPWDINDQDGRWLVWRDIKIMNGRWRNYQVPTCFKALHVRCPYDSRRPLPDFSTRMHREDFRAPWPMLREPTTITKVRSAPSLSTKTNDADKTCPVATKPERKADGRQGRWGVKNEKPPKPSSKLPSQAESGPVDEQRTNAVARRAVQKSIKNPPTEDQGSVTPGVQEDISSIEEESVEFVRKKRLAFFTQNPSKAVPNTEHTLSPTRPSKDESIQGPPLCKDSLVSGSRSCDLKASEVNQKQAKRWKQKSQLAQSRNPKPKPVEPRNPNSRPRKGGSSTSLPMNGSFRKDAILASDNPPPKLIDCDLEPSATELNPVPTTLRPDVDPNKRPRDEDLLLMPIPRKLGFQFDPRQLQDIGVIQRGGNGCARQGEEYNIEIDNEWGGGGNMGWKSSTACEQSDQGEPWEGGKGDDGGLLGELPGI